LSLLKARSGASAGNLRVIETQAGLQIVGSIDGPAPDYARSATELAAKDRVTVWLSGMPKLPEFEPPASFTCDNSSSAEEAKCREKEAAKPDYPANLSRLFVRRWSMAPGIAAETYATDAFANASRFNSVPDEFKPKQAPKMSATGANFFISVDWSDFPPIRFGTLSTIKLVVEFCAAGQSCATTAPGHANDSLDGWNALELSQPKSWKITECGYLAGEFGSESDSNPTWIFPTGASLVNQALTVDYADIGGWVGPANLQANTYAATRIGANGWYCDGGRYLVGSQSYTLNQADAERADASLVEPGVPAVHELGNGAYLVSTGLMMGPYTDHETYSLSWGRIESEGNFGTLLIYYLDPLRGISLAYRGDLPLQTHTNFGEPLKNPNADGDIQISPDWTALTEYLAPGFFEGEELKVRRWTSKRFCLQGTKYQPCGRGSAGPPPEPRNYTGPR
jgi:hypothetical protein